MPISTPAPAPSPAPPKPKPKPKPKDESGLKKGWLSSGTLYPEGSTEAAPQLWRSKDIVERAGKIFTLDSSEAGYEIRGTFKEAGRFLGKEDFEVTRTGLTLRIRGHPDADAQSLVKGLDESVTLPADADFSSISADYTDSVLSIRVGVNMQLRDAIKQLSPEEAQEIARKHGIASLPSLARGSEEEAPDRRGQGGRAGGGGERGDDEEAAAVEATTAALAAARVAQEAEERQQRTPGYWARVGQTIGLAVTASSQRDTSTEATEADAKAICTALCANGFADLPRANWASGDASLRLTSFARAIDHLETLGLPPAFLMVFDEPWAMVTALAAHLSPALGQALCYEIAVGNIKPGGEGRPMRRDKPGGDSKRAFTDEGVPKRCTISLALTNADPRTSCMYAVPAPRDPHYRCALDADAAAARDDGDLKTIFAEAHTRVRALPVAMGDALVWSHRLIHWETDHGGGEGTCKTLSFAMGDTSFQPPLLARAVRDGEPPPFDARLALIALRLVASHHEDAVPKRLIPLVLGTLRQSAALLSDEALTWGSATGGAFQRNLVAIHDELLDLASSFAGLAAYGRPMATDPTGANAHSPAEQAAAAAAARQTAEQSMAHAVACGAIAAHIITARRLEAAESLKRVASAPTERSLEPTDAAAAERSAAAAASSAAAAIAAADAAASKATAGAAASAVEIEPVAAEEPSRFEEVD